RATFLLTRPTALPRTPLLHVAPHSHLGGPASIDVARVVHADAFWRSGLDRRLRNEGGDLAVLDAADADAWLEARIVARGRLRIGDVDHVVLVDGNVARPPELLPFGNELAVRLENLNAVVGAVGDVDASRRIERDAVRRLEFARPLAALAPRGDECPVLGELDDTIVGALAVPIGDIDVAVGRDHDRAARAQIAGSVAGHSRLAQNHQHLAVGSKLDEIRALAVPGDLVAAPDIAVAVDVETVRNRELVRADRRLKFARGIELLHRRERRIRAFPRSPTVEYPDALAIAVIDLDLDGRAEFPALFELRPGFLHLVRIGRGIGVGALRVKPLTRHPRQRASGSRDQHCRSKCMAHGRPPAALILACCSWRPSDRRLALEQEAIEVAALAHVVVRIGLVHDAAVVPHHPVARTPLVAIFVFFLRGVP